MPLGTYIYTHMYIRIFEHSFLHLPGYVTSHGWFDCIVRSSSIASQRFFRFLFFFLFLLHLETFSTPLDRRLSDSYILRSLLHPTVFARRPREPVPRIARLVDFRCRRCPSPSPSCSSVTDLQGQATWIIPRARVTANYSPLSLLVWLLLSPY